MPPNAQPNLSTAVIPIAGRATRMRPATLAVPKALLPINGAPLLHHAVRETRLANIHKLIFVASPEHLHPLNLWLARSNTLAGASVQLIIQQQPLGLGHAVKLALNALPKNNPFALILPDDLILPTSKQPSALAAMHKVAQLHPNSTIIAAQHVPPQLAHQYGVFRISSSKPPIVHADMLVEKPPNHLAPSSLAAVGRYIIPPQVQTHILNAQPNINGEIQITDALSNPAHKTPLIAFLFHGTRYDCGSHVGYSLANVAAALQNPTLKPLILKLASQ